MLPMVELTIFALGILLIDLIVPREWKWINALGAFMGVAFAAVCVAQIQWALPRGSIGFSKILYWLIVSPSTSGNLFSGRRCDCDPDVGPLSRH